MTIAIPSHNRAELISNLSLKFAIEQLRTDPNDIYIFVSNDKMLNDYKAIIQHKVNYVVTNTNTARDKFNYIHRYWSDNRDVLLIEDDVSGMVGITDRSPRKIVSIGFELMHKAKLSIWGIYPSANKLFMQQSVTTGFSFIVANIYGFIADGDDRVCCQELCKADYERSILYTIHKGGVVRLNYVAPVTKNYKTKGGMQDTPNRAKDELISCQNLIKRFPNLVSIKKGTKSIYTEINLIKRRAK